VQHFRPRRTHAGAFAGRKHNGKTGTLDRQWTSSARHASAAGAVISECVAPEKVECARSPRQQNDAIRGNRQSRLRRFIPGQGADGGSGLVPVSSGLCAKHTRRIVRRPMQSQLFLPTARQTNWLLLLTLLSLGEALYLRYLAIEYAQVSLACQAGLDTWLCATFRLVIVLFNYSAFGWIALGAALLNLLRPSILLVALALAATAFGLVLHNANLAGVAAALLMLSLARPAPAAE